MGNTEEDFHAIGLEPVFDRSSPRCMDSILLDCPVNHLILDFFDRVRLGLLLRSEELERALAAAALPEEPEA